MMTFSNIPDELNCTLKDNMVKFETNNISAFCPSLARYFSNISVVLMYGFNDKIEKSVSKVCEKYAKITSPDRHFE